MSFKVKINNIEVDAENGETILDVAKRVGIQIPTLCFLKNVNETACCRVCVVEVNGFKNPVTSCTTKVKPDMEINTTSPKILKARKTAVELLLSNHNKNCLSCPKNLKCNLQSLSEMFNCDEHAFKQVIDLEKQQIDDTNYSIVRDPSKCILCGRCVAVCSALQGVEAIGKINRGINTKIGCVLDENLVNSNCVGCGQCVLVCPTGALMEKDNTQIVQEYINDPNIFTIVQIAPSVRVAMGESFGLEMGTFTEGKIATALRRLGFDKIFDVNNGADFTVIEEGKELLGRLREQKKLPMFSSCCPAWYNFIENEYPKYIPNLSTCKSPNEMLGSLVKYYYKDQVQKVKVISIMPCTAKKREIIKHNNAIDIVLTTRELAKLIKQNNIDFNSLPDGNFDKPFGEYSGGGLIFGVTGGVTEAVLRMVTDVLAKGTTPDFKDIRNSKGIKEVEVAFDKLKLRIAIVNGLGNAKKIMEDIESGKAHYDFLEIMACKGGCVNGGGQPYVDYRNCSYDDVVKKRGSSLYKKDSTMQNKVSSNNKSVKNIYKNLLKDDEQLIHKLLHVETKDKK